jgi:hypothetical protein
LPTDICQFPSDLALVVERWPELPETIRAGILAMDRLCETASQGT